MNREQIYVEFRKKVESDDNYFTFGRYGIIEEILAYFGLASKEFRGSHACVHEDNLKTLHDFMINEATVRVDLSGCYWQGANTRD